MTTLETLFYANSIVAVLTAAMVILHRNPVVCALSLAMHLCSVAAFFLLLNASFLFAVQIIVYAGAIVVLFLFVIMLLGVDKSEDLSIEPFPIQRPAAIVIGAAVAGLVIAAVVRARDTLMEGSPLPADDDQNIRALARNLFQDHVFAFEFTSVLLIVAIAGTVVLTRKDKRKVDR
jgi:NADH-quinone oxidoreductase subunit J